MSMTLLQLRNHVKSSRGFTRDREDGLLPDSLIDEAIESAIRRVATDCELKPTEEYFALIAGQYRYPMPERVTQLRDVWRKDSSGSWQPLTQISQDAFRYGHDPVDNTAKDPNFYAYPIFKGEPYQFYVIAPPRYDYVAVSRITQETKRTVYDSGANFGKTWSGKRISPGDVVYNETDQSMGYIKTLDMATLKTSGSCNANTSSTQVSISGANFDALGIEKDDIICYPATGIPTTYAFVTSVSGSVAYYEDIRGSLSTFASGNSVKIGKANKIILDIDAPHRGLRGGSRNGFYVGSDKATLTGTVFSDTGCTCSSTTGAEVGDEAIASGGSHGKITAVGSASITVEMWIGGVPANGESLTVKECDEYRLETEPLLQQEIWLKPTPSTSDNVGEERLHVEFDRDPYIPTEDWQYVDIPPKWEDALKACCRWQSAILAGSHSATQLDNFKTEYLSEVSDRYGDIHQTAKGEILSPWLNRRAGQTSGQPYEGSKSGIVYDGDAMVADQNS